MDFRRIFKMKKAVIIIPYFGVFPSFFQLFLDSCSNNTLYTWLIYTDIEKEYNIPSNVLIKHIKFTDFIKRIQDKFDFEIEIIRPHKLCDFKVAYGYIFEEEIKEFEYWGHGDLDLIYGNLDNFLSPLINEGYDKIYSLGHLSLYKNTHDINRVFMGKHNGNFPYQIIFSTDKAFAFDEWHCPLPSINHMFLDRNFKFFEVNQCANLSSTHSNFRLSNYIINFRNYATDANYNNVFSVVDGILKRYYLIDGRVEKKEYPYIHFHKRSMRVENDNLAKMLIVPNAFKPLNTIDASLIKTYSKNKLIDSQYFKTKIINIRYRIKQLLK